MIVDKHTIKATKKIGDTASEAKAFTQFIRIYPETLRSIDFIDIATDDDW